MVKTIIPNGTDYLNVSVSSKYSALEKCTRYFNRKASREKGTKNNEETYL